MAMEPWRFTIEFDEEKAKRNGYNVDDLYDCVGKYAEQMGNVRIGLGTWQAKSREVQFGAQALEATRAARARDENRDDRPPQRSWGQSR